MDEFVEYMFVCFFAELDEKGFFLFFFYFILLPYLFYFFLLFLSVPL